MCLNVSSVVIEDKSFNGASEIVKLMQDLEPPLLSHSMMIVKLSSSKISPVMLSHRISG